MDYSGWELERQRRALAALLLGGGTAENRETGRESPRRHPEAGPAEARSPGGGEAGWYSAGFDEDNPGAREAVRRAGQDRAAPSGTLPGIREDGAEAAPPQGFGNPARGAPEGPGRMGGKLPGRKAGGQEEKGAASSWQAVREAAWDEAPHKAFFSGTFRAAGEAVSGGGEDAGAALSERTSAREEDTGSGGPRPRLDGAGLRNGGGVGKWDGTPFFRAVDVPAGTRFRNGGGGSAALQAEDGAKALSRAVQRDARRYDSGFTIY